MHFLTLESSLITPYDGNKNQSVPIPPYGVSRCRRDHFKNISWSVSSFGKLVNLSDAVFHRSCSVGMFIKTLSEIARAAASSPGQY